VNGNGTNSNGIYAYNSSAGGDSYVRAGGAVDSRSEGILLRDSGNGVSEVIGAYAVTSLNKAGIAAYAYGGGDLNISSAYVRGGTDGVFAYNSASGGALSVTASNSLVGKGGAGAP
jgi:hypothetical protein